MRLASPPTGTPIGRFDLYVFAFAFNVLSAPFFATRYAARALGVTLRFWSRWAVFAHGTAFHLAKCGCCCGDGTTHQDRRAQRCCTKWIAAACALALRAVLQVLRLALAVALAAVLHGAGLLLTGLLAAGAFIFVG